MERFVTFLIIIAIIVSILTGCSDKTVGGESPNVSDSASDTQESEVFESIVGTEDITDEVETEIEAEIEPEEDSLPPADSNIGGLLDEVPPENEYLRGYFDEMKELLAGWRDEGKFGINKLGVDLTLPRIDIVIATDSDSEALKNELISMGDYSEDIPYYNEEVIRITIGEHFPDDMR